MKSTILLAMAAMFSLSIHAATAKENLFKLEGIMSARKLELVVRDAVLKSKKVSDAVANKDIELSKITSKRIDHNFTLITISLSAQEAGLGLDGPSSHPCSISIEVMRGSGITVSANVRRVNLICAQNGLKF